MAFSAALLQLTTVSDGGHPPEIPKPPTQKNE